MAEVVSELIPTENSSNLEKCESLETLASEKRGREEDEENVSEISKKSKVEDDGEATKDKDGEMTEKEEENGNEMSKKPEVDDNDEDEETKEKDEEMKEKEGSVNLGPKEDDEGTKVKDEETKEKEEDSANLGPKEFESGEAMFNYFFKLLHHWSPNVDINKYEYMVLLDLIKKGHEEADKKIGSGIKAFQVRYHPMWKSRCFFLVRVDGSIDDFSFRKCVDHILSLPENMKIPSSNGKNKFDGRKDGRQQRGGGGGGWGGRGRGGGRGHGRKGRGWA